MKNLFDLYVKICLELVKKREKNSKTAAFKILDSKFQKVIRETLNSSQLQLWNKQPHIRSRILLNMPINQPLKWNEQKLFLNLNHRTNIQYEPSECYPISSKHLGQRK